MESRAKLFGHPIHQMLVVFPLGLLATAVVFDVIALARSQGYWSELAFWMIAAGVITGLLAAPFGFVDWLAIPSGTRAKRIGAVHGLGNVLIVLLFATSWLMRRNAPAAPQQVALALSFVAGGSALINGLARRRAGRSPRGRGGRGRAPRRAQLAAGTPRVRA